VSTATRDRTERERLRIQLLAQKLELAGALQTLEPVLQQSDAEAGAADHRRLELLEVRELAIQQIEAALERLQAGQYGHCSACGREIADRRLRVLPTAALCMHCQFTREGWASPAPRHGSRRRVSFIEFLPGIHRPFTPGGQTPTRILE
jgi:DnaK suppressor protein